MVCLLLVALFGLVSYAPRQCVCVIMWPREKARLAVPRLSVLYGGLAQWVDDRTMPVSSLSSLPDPVILELR